MLLRENKGITCKAELSQLEARDPRETGTEHQRVMSAPWREITNKVAAAGGYTGDKTLCCHLTPRHIQDTLETERIRVIFLPAFF